MRILEQDKRKWKGKNISEQILRKFFRTKGQKLRVLSQNNERRPTSRSISMTFQGTNDGREDL